MSVAHALVLAERMPARADTHWVKTRRETNIMGLGTRSNERSELLAFAPTSYRN
ncbi:MAG: hypothetical protein HY930_04375 [Euryarchaeota archaeon]|nr:hypothetical protein [Euryarchaeota archaeon]